MKGEEWPLCDASDEGPTNEGCPRQAAERRDYGDLGVSYLCAEHAAQWDGQTIFDLYGILAYDVIKVGGWLGSREGEAQRIRDEIP